MASLFGTEPAIEALVVKANAFLKQQARKPRVDTTAMRAETRKLEGKIKKLVMQVEDEPNKDLCVGYNKRIKELQAHQNGLLSKMREADRQNRKVVKPLDLKRAKVYLEDMRGLLNQEIPAAAEAIRTLTGPITIR